MCFACALAFNVHYVARTPNSGTYRQVTKMYGKMGMSIRRATANLPFAGFSVARCISQRTRAKIARSNSSMPDSSLIAHPPSTRSYTACHYPQDEYPQASRTSRTVTASHAPQRRTTSL